MLKQSSVPDTVSASGGHLWSRPKKKKMFEIRAESTRRESGRGVFFQREDHREKGLKTREESLKIHVWTAVIAGVTSPAHTMRHCHSASAGSWTRDLGHRRHVMITQTRRCSELGGISGRSSCLHHGNSWRHKGPHRVFFKSTFLCSENASLITPLARYQARREQSDHLDVFFFFFFSHLLRISWQ